MRRPGPGFTRLTMENPILCQACGAPHAVSSAEGVRLLSMSGPEGPVRTSGIATCDGDVTSSQESSGTTEFKASVAGRSQHAMRLRITQARCAMMRRASLHCLRYNEVCRGDAARLVHSLHLVSMHAVAVSYSVGRRAPAVDSHGRRAIVSLDTTGSVCERFDKHTFTLHREGAVRLLHQTQALAQSHAHTRAVSAPSPIPGPLAGYQTNRHPWLAAGQDNADPDTHRQLAVLGVWLH